MFIDIDMPTPFNTEALPTPFICRSLTGTDFDTTDHIEKETKPFQKKGTALKTGGSGAREARTLITVPGVSGLIVPLYDPVRSIGTVMCVTMSPVQIPATYDGDSFST